MQTPEALQCPLTPPTRHLAKLVLTVEGRQTPVALHLLLLKQGFWAGGPHLLPPRRNLHFVEQHPVVGSSHCSPLSTTWSPQNREWELVALPVPVPVGVEVPVGEAEFEVV